ncbi:MAG: CFI-box-CTERM domain-containing protein, partial [Candidatus Hydrogenedentota bacterium]
GTVDLTDGSEFEGPGTYTATVQAMATADDYYNVSQLGSASQDVMVTINVSTPVDSDGDSMPNANEREGIVSSNSGQITFLGTGESGASLTTHLTTLTANPTLRALIVSEDYYTSGVTYNLFFTAPTLSAIHAAAGYYDTVLDATEAIIFATVSLVSGDLTGDEGDDPAMAIPGVEDVFVRLIILHNGLGSGIWTSIDALSSSTMIFLTVETTGLDEDITRVLQYIKPLDLVTSGEDLTFMDAGSWSDADDSASTADLRDVGNVTPTGFSSIFTDLGLMACDVNPDDDPPVEPPTSSSSTCFIATAAFGTPMAEEINTLRAVRDTYMLNNIVGTAFVDAYYRLSPTIADKVAESPLLAAVVRAMLTPFILVGKLILSAPMALMALMLAGAGLVLAHRRTRGSQS